MFHLFNLCEDSLIFSVLLKVIIILYLSSIFNFILVLYLIWSVR